MGVGIFTGVPKQLGGVSKLLQMMDWQSGEGEENEGMVGDYLNFGNVGADHVVNEHELEDGTKVHQDDVFIIIAPQSMVGVDSSIIGPLKEMTEAAGDRPVILLNPDLKDKPSAQGQQNVRGRQVSIEYTLLYLYFVSVAVLLHSLCSIANFWFAFNSCRFSILGSHGFCRFIQDNMAFSEHLRFRNFLLSNSGSYLQTRTTRHVVVLSAPGSCQ